MSVIRKKHIPDPGSRGQKGTKKIVKKLLNIRSWDPGSGKNLFRIPDPGSRGQKGSGSRIRIRNTASNFPLPSSPQFT